MSFHGGQSVGVGLEGIYRALSGCESNNRLRRRLGLIILVRKEKCEFESNVVISVDHSYEAPFSRDAS